MTEPTNDRDNAEFRTPFFSAKIAGKNLTLRDIVLVFIFGGMVFVGVVNYEHAESSDKANTALFKEIKESNRVQTQTQKSIAFYQCKSACILEYDQKDRTKGSTACDNICAPVKQ